MNYVYDPQVAAKIAAVRELRDAGRRAPRRCSQKTDPKLATNELIFPDEATLVEAAAVPDPRPRPRSAR